MIQPKTRKYSKIVMLVKGLAKCSKAVMPAKAGIQYGEGFKEDIIFLDARLRWHDKFS